MTHPADEQITDPATQTNGIRGRGLDIDAIAIRVHRATEPGHGQAVLDVAPAYDGVRVRLVDSPRVRQATRALREAGYATRPGGWAGDDHNIVVATGWNRERLAQRIERLAEDVSRWQRYYPDTAEGAIADFQRLTDEDGLDDTAATTHAVEQARAGVRDRAGEAASLSIREITAAYDHAGNGEVYPQLRKAAALDQAMAQLTEQHAAHAQLAIRLFKASRDDDGYLPPHAAEFALADLAKVTQRPVDLAVNELNVDGDLDDPIFAYERDGLGLGELDEVAEGSATEEAEADAQFLATEFTAAELHDVAQDVGADDSLRATVQRATELRKAEDAAQDGAGPPDLTGSVAEGEPAQGWRRELANEFATRWAPSDLDRWLGELADNPEVTDVEYRDAQAAVNSAIHDGADLADTDPAALPGSVEDDPDYQHHTSHDGVSTPQCAYCPGTDEHAQELARHLHEADQAIRRAQLSLAGVEAARQFEQARAEQTRWHTADEATHRHAANVSQAEPTLTEGTS